MQERFHEVIWYRIIISKTHRKYQTTNEKALTSNPTK
jgi:hypothetical protein